MRVSRRWTGWVLLSFAGWAPAAFAAKAVSSPNAGLGVPAGADPFGVGSLGQFVLGLVVVVGVILALAWVLRRMNHVQGSVQGRLRILAGLSLGSRERVVLLQVGEEQILLGVAPGRVSRLHVLQQPLEPGSGQAETGEKFRARLAAAIQRRRSQ